MSTPTYSKHNNVKLFNDLEKMNLYNLQNYVPIYNLFFKMNEDNSSQFNLNISERLLSIEKFITYNVAEVNVGTLDHIKRKKQVFFTFTITI